MSRLVAVDQQIRRLRGAYDNSSRVLEGSFTTSPALEAAASRLRPLVEECAAATNAFLAALEATPEYIEARERAGEHAGDFTTTR